MPEESALIRTSLPSSMVRMQSRLRAAHLESGQFAFEFFQAPLDVLEFVGAEGIIEHVQHGQDTGPKRGGLCLGDGGLGHSSSQISVDINLYRQHVIGKHVHEELSAM